jgi:hypothetical protein
MRKLIGEDQALGMEPPVKTRSLYCKSEGCGTRLLRIAMCIVLRSNYGGSLASRA